MAGSKTESQGDRRKGERGICRSAQQITINKEDK